MMQVKQMDFSGLNIFCGIDVHKKSWRINIQDSEFELEDFSQPPQAVLLYKHLMRKYPGASFKVCYEAGFSGFGLQRWLNGHGIDCQVVNAADVISSCKDKSRKNDKTDARRLCEHLQSKKMSGIYVPAIGWEHSRALVRGRSKIVRDQTRCKNRIMQLLYCHNLEIPGGYNSYQYWSKNFIRSLQQLDCGSEMLRATLDLYIANFTAVRQLLLEATRQVRKLCRKQEYKQNVQLLRTIPGVGEVNAAVFLFELQDIHRFSHTDNLCAYAGLVPDTGDSGETKVNKGITYRANTYLREALVESSWTVIRKDPALLLSYKKFCSRMPRNKAIIRICKQLLSRIRYVLVNQKEYVTGVVG